MATNSNRERSLKELMRVVKDYSFLWSKTLSHSIFMCYSIQHARQERAITSEECDRLLEYVRELVNKVGVARQGPGFASQYMFSALGLNVPDLDKLKLFWEKTIEEL